MKKYNFNAGPSMLPREVIENTAKQILDFNGSGLLVRSWRSHHRPTPTTLSTHRCLTMCQLIVIICILLATILYMVLSFV